MCHVSCVMCHVSPVTCQIIFLHNTKEKKLFFCILKKIGQSGGASRWTVCYQRGLPRLVSSNISVAVLLVIKVLLKIFF